MENKPIEDFERDYFRELFLIDWEKNAKKKIQKKEYEIDKKRMKVEKRELKELIEC